MQHFHFALKIAWYQNFWYWVFSHRKMSWMDVFEILPYLCQCHLAVEAQKSNLIIKSYFSFVWTFKRKTLQLVSKKSQRQLSISVPWKPMMYTEVNSQLKTAEYYWAKPPTSPPTCRWCVQAKHVKSEYM